MELSTPLTLQFILFLAHTHSSTMTIWSLNSMSFLDLLSVEGSTGTLA